MIDGLWGQLTDQLVKNLVKNIGSQIEQQIFARLEQFVKSEIKIAFTEEEAAEKLGIEKTKLATVRRNGEISHYQYGKSATYGLHHLLDYATRYEIKTMPPKFKMETKVSLFGAEVKR